MEMKKSGREIGVIAMRKQVYISTDYWGQTPLQFS